MYNEIDGDFEDVVISTFKVGLPTEHGLRKSLTGKPVTNVHQLMDINTRGLRKTSNKEKVKQRLSLKR